MVRRENPVALKSFLRSGRKQGRIIGALIMRELVTRYGREGLGFLWIVLEPLVFCFGVMALWTLMKPEYEHGVRVAPFVMTGYMCLLLFRHIVGSFGGAIVANVGLLHHRDVKPVHLYFSRAVIELAGGTMAFFVVYVVLLALGAVSPPRDYVTLYGAYLILAWLSAGFGMTMASLAIRYEVVERIMPVSMYLMIPLSGAFVMVDWLPHRYQWIYLLNPLPHTVEMVRSSVFGEFVPTHFNPLYPIAWAAGLTLLGLLLLAQTRRYLDID